MTAQATHIRIASTLRKKVRRFYEHANRGELEWCYRALDPCVRATPSGVTLYQFVDSFERFLERYGRIDILQIDPIELHLNEPNRLYNDRDFALFQLLWEDRFGSKHVFRERWVRDRRGRWYTRSTGLVTPKNRK